MAPPGAMFFFLLILGLSSHPGEPLRPCCLNDGSCFDLTEAMCATVGGSVSKASSCADAQCVAVGACCTSGLNCAEEISESDCNDLGGTWMGAASDCIPVPCPFEGGCCLPDGTCFSEDADLCREAGGFPRGLEISCDEITCLGACCLSESCESNLSLQECVDQGGDLQGFGSVCPNDCQQVVTDVVQGPWGLPGMQELSAPPFDDHGGYRVPISTTVEIKGRTWTALRLRNLGDSPISTDAILLTEMLLGETPFIAENKIIGCCPGDCLPPLESCTFGGTFQSEGELVVIDPTWPLDVFARSVAEYTAPGSIEFSQYPVLGELSVRITTTFEVLGGCCLCDGSCSLTSETGCATVGGVWSGQESPCLPSCVPTGSCCLNCGSVCLPEITEADCFKLSGQWLGPCNTCASGCVPLQACVLCDGTCVDLSHESECIDLDGQWVQECALCAEITSAAFGACCICNEPCQTATLSGCSDLGGTWLGGCSDCSVAPCGGQGGCCLCGPVEECAPLDELDCHALGGRWLGDCVSCASDSCRPVSVCETQFYGCQEGVLETDCRQCRGSTWGTPGEDCDCLLDNPTFDNPPGPCCLPDGRCTEHNLRNCAELGGQFQCQLQPPNGDPYLATCEALAVECNPVIACCLPDQSCRTLSPDQCLNAGGFGEPGCANSASCQTPVCCLDDGSCLALPESACSLVGGRSRGKSCAPAICGRDIRRANIQKNR